MSNTVTSGANVKVQPPIEVPKPSPRVGISDPEFDKLTAAEKLNDRNYREMIYQTYPNEETCACKPEVSMSSGKSNVEAESPRNWLVCRSGCKRACCSSVRQQSVASPQQDNANKNDKVSLVPFMPTYYCVDGPPENGCEEDRMKGGHNSRYCGFQSRLRGGGEGGREIYERRMHPQSGQVNRTIVRSLDDAWNGISRSRVVDRRLEAGGGYEYMERYPVNRNLGLSATTAQFYNEKSPPRTEHCKKQTQQDSHLDTSHLRASTNTCRPPQPFGTAAGCCCPGKETLVRSTRQRNPICAKRPCPSVDCLIKTFKETQEFVESLGKVPGLAGLGLMDPTESPYFGRAKLKNSKSEAIQSSAEISGLSNLPNPQCVGPCNPQMAKNFGGFPVATPFTIAVPGRGGVVREAVPSLPGPGLRYSKSRKRDDKELEASDSLTEGIEAAPCGEPRCRAKKRKNVVAEDLPSEDVLEEATKKVAADINSRRISRTVNKVKGGSKTRSGRRSSEPGPGGDRAGRRKSVRRTMRFVYSAGDSYSGLTCGHKDCIEERRRVPWNMGWLWNVNETVGRLKPRVGWKPGAIARHISEILREAKANLLLDHKSRPKTRSSASSRSKSRSVTSRGKRVKTQNDRRPAKKQLTKNKKEEEEEAVEPPSTLNVKRKNGTYYVTMYPIKQDRMDIPKLEVPMKPLQFKIAKNRDDTSIATSSTASDMEIEFSPPAAVNRYRKKPNVVHVDTQVRQQEIFDAFKNDNDKKKDKKKVKKGKK